MAKTARASTRSGSVDDGRRPGQPPELDGRRRGTAVDKAVQHLQLQIDLRRVLPGEPLPSAQAMAEEIGVNRMAVLQALQMLQRDGLVVVRPGRAGARVIPLDHRPPGQRLSRAVSRRDFLREAAPLREILESGAARLAATNGMKPPDVAEARELIDGMRRAEDRDRFHALDNRFHDLIARAGGSKLTESLCTALRRDAMVCLDAFDLDDERLERSNKEHERLLAAIVAGAGSRAAEWAHRHATGTTALILSGLPPEDFGG